MTTPTKAKKITELPENTTISDDDLFVTGMGGTSAMGKTKWSKILDKIRSVLFANNLTTNTVGYALDARQGPVIDKRINELNTNLNVRNYFPANDYTGNLIDVLTGSNYPRGIIFLSTQNAPDSPYYRVISFTITIKIDNNWGGQWVFTHDGRISNRYNQAGKVSDWGQVI